MRGDRIDQVGVLDLVEQALDDNARGGSRGDGRSAGCWRSCPMPRGRLSGSAMPGVAIAPAATTTTLGLDQLHDHRAPSRYSTPLASEPRGAVLDQNAPAPCNPRAVRAAPPPTADGCRRSSSSCRRSSGIPVGTSRTACSWHRCRTSPARARRRSPRSPGPRCGRTAASRPAPAPQSPLNPLEIGPQIGSRERLVPPRRAVRRRHATSRSPRRTGRSATFVLIVVVPPTQRPRNNGIGGARRPWRLGERSGHQMLVVGCASQRMKSAAVGAGRPRAAARCDPVGELAGHDTAAGARADHHTSYRSLIPSPPDTTSPC